MRRTARELLNAEGVNLKSYALGEHRAACAKCAIAKQRTNDDALAAIIDDKGFQLKCHRCGWVAFGFYEEREATDARARKSPAPANEAPESQASELSRRRDDERKQALVMKILKETAPAEGNAVETYLRGRAIVCALPPCLRFHPNLWHSDLKRSLPAMVAPLRDIKTNAICGLHRTYLNAEGTGKITEATARKMFGRSKGAAIKLTLDDEIEQGLSIAEGIETGLSVLGAGFPVWATGSADGIKEFPVFAGIECLTIFSDPDPVGMKAAEMCAQRWCDAGSEARILIPAAADSGDWNDFAKRAA